MKDSGIPWIGMIPEDWEVLPFKSIFKTSKGLSITKDNLTDKGVAVINYGQIHSKANKGTGVTNDIIRYVSEDYLITSSNALVGSGDFVFADTSEDVDGCGNCCYIDYNDKIFAGYHTIIARAKLQNNNKYCAYLFQTPLWRFQIQSEANGIKVYSITQKMVNNTLIIYPPLAEQEAIASWLDEKCGEIDELIEVEQKMIVELESYRQAIITETVTRGLNPDAPMRQTGISWIPEIPEHWNKDKVLRLFGLFGSGTTPKGEEWFVDEGGIPWINSGELNFGDLYSTKKSVSPLALSDISALKVYPINSILIAMYGASIGKIAISKIEGCTNQACFVMSKEREDVCLKYVFYQLYSFKERWSELSYGGTQPNINADNIKQTWLALPPVEEQRAIADYLDTKCQEIDELIAVKREKIDTLKQYRQSIIFEAVTGKIQIN